LSVPKPVQSAQYPDELNEHAFLYCQGMQLVGHTCNGQLPWLAEPGPE
jgi:hypothetical protein